MKELFYTFLFKPLYNALIFLIDIIPGGDIGFAVIILTILVKLILFPLSIKSVRTQLKMKVLQKPLKEIQEKYKDNKEMLGVKMLELYREHKINPFSGFILILIQIPVILALYWVFLRGGFPEIRMDLVYSFVPKPENMNLNFLGIVDLSQSKSIIFALTAAITQFFQARFAFPKIETNKDGKSSFQEDLMKGMSIQIKYVLPIVIFFISYSLIAAVSLYWTVSNLFAIGQELYVRKHIKDKDGNQIPAKS